MPNAGAAASQHEGGGSSSSESRFTSFTRAGFVSAVRKATQRPASLLLHIPTTQIVPVEPLRKKAKVIIDDAVEVHSDTSESEVDQTSNACLEDIPQRFPKRIDYARGDQRGLDDATADETSVDAMHALKFSQSGALSRNAREAWWRRRVAARGVEPYPLSVRAISLAAALLRQGGYRSASLYL